MHESFQYEFSIRPPHKDCLSCCTAVTVLKHPACSIRNRWQIQWKWNHWFIVRLMVSMWMRVCCQSMKQKKIWFRTFPFWLWPQFVFEACAFPKNHWIDKRSIVAPIWHCSQCLSRWKSFVLNLLYITWKVGTVAVQRRCYCCRCHSEPFVEKCI